MVMQSNNNAAMKVNIMCESEWVEVLRVYELSDSLYCMEALWEVRYSIVKDYHSLMKEVHFLKCESNFQNIQKKIQHIYKWKGIFLKFSCACVYTQETIFQMTLLIKHPVFMKLFYEKSCKIIKIFKKTNFHKIIKL